MLVEYGAMHYKQNRHAIRDEMNIFPEAKADAFLDGFL